MDPDVDVDDRDGLRPDRPLPPPPTVRDLVDGFRQRVAFGHPGLDLSKILLGVAALVGIGGMTWAVWASRASGGDPAPIQVAAATTTPSTTTAVTTTSTPTRFIVDVAGAVHSPGPVEVPHTARVDDAIEAAGGARGEADLERVDRAAPLIDGQRIYVPTVGQTEIPEVVGSTGPVVPPTAEGTGGDAAGPVDVNVADEAELTGLPGVGPATAQAIIAHRETNGPFAEVDDLLEVRGIGPVKMENLRPHVTV